MGLQGDLERLLAASTVLALPDGGQAEQQELFSAFGEPVDIGFDALEVDWLILEQSFEIAELAIELAIGLLEVAVQHDLHKSDEVAGQLLLFG